MTDLPLAKKSLGQHWLHDPASLEAMAEAAGVHSGDTVLEIGPGTGTLTDVLLASGAKVIAVEKDEALAAGLLRKFAGKSFDLVTGSILEFDLTSLPPDYKLVANIPYYLTSHLIRLIGESPNPPCLAVILVQKEVAERVAAQPGDMSMLSATAQFYWNVSLGRVVGAKLFSPPPKVDSQILIMNRRKEPAYAVDIGDFFRIIKAGFSSRRKTLANSLSGGLRLDKVLVIDKLVEAGKNPRSRPQELSLKDWYDIYQKFSDAK